MACLKVKYWYWNYYKHVTLYTMVNVCIFFYKVHHDINVMVDWMLQINYLSNFPEYSYWVNMYAYERTRACSSSPSCKRCHCIICTGPPSPASYGFFVLEMVQGWQLRYTACRCQILLIPVVIDQPLGLRVNCCRVHVLFELSPLQGCPFEQVILMKQAEICCMLCLGKYH